jgi:outer membrane protein TolC
MKISNPVRFFAFSLSLMSLATGVLAQQKNAPANNQVYRPVAPPPAQPIMDAAGYRAVDSVEEKLVRMALDGPQLRSAADQNKINEYTLRQARQAWTNLLTLSLNLNDLDFQKQQTNGVAYVYPKYFFGLNIPLGTLFSRTQVKAAREQVKIGVETQTTLSRQIRSTVLEKYRTYKMKKELLKLQIQVTDDEQAAFLQVEKSYRDGTVPLEAHISAQEKYNTELVKRMNLQLELDVAKLGVEELIGTNLETVTNN